MLALAAYDNQVPVYCVVPTSTIDPSLEHEEIIPIEERSPREVLESQVDGHAVDARRGVSSQPGIRCDASSTTYGSRHRERRNISTLDGKHQ